MEHKTTAKENKSQKEETRDHASFQKMLGQSDNSSTQQENNYQNLINNDPILKKMTEQSNNNPNRILHPLNTPNSLYQNANIKTANQGFVDPSGLKQNYINNNINNINNINNYYQFVGRNKIFKMKDGDFFNQEPKGRLISSTFQNLSYGDEIDKSYKTNLKKNKSFITKINQMKKKVWIILISSLLLFCLNLSMCLNKELEYYDTFIIISLILSACSCLVNLGLIISLFMGILSDIYLSNVFRLVAFFDFFLSIAMIIIHLCATMQILPEIDGKKEKTKILCLMLGICVLIILCISMTTLIGFESFLVFFRCRNEYVFEALGYNKRRNYAINYVKLNEETVGNNLNTNKVIVTQNKTNNENQK